MHETIPPLLIPCLKPLKDMIGKIGKGALLTPGLTIEEFTSDLASDVNSEVIKDMR